jgi:hypothetical protein
MAAANFKLALFTVMGRSSKAPVNTGSACLAL